MKTQELFKVTSIVSLVLALLCSEAGAQGLPVTRWQATLGDWSDDANWLDNNGYATEPTAEIAAFVDNGGTFDGAKLQFAGHLTNELTLSAVSSREKK